MTLGRLVKGLREKSYEVHIIDTAEGGDDEDETPELGVGLLGYNEPRVFSPAMSWSYD